MSGKQRVFQRGIEFLFLWITLGSADSVDPDAFVARSDIPSGSSLCADVCI